MTNSGIAKVLVIEDNNPIRALAVESLRDEGFDVTEVPTGDDAMALLDNKEHFDVLFTDVRMPGKMDGVDVAEHVRAHYPQMPVLIASGYAAQLTNRLQRLGPPLTFINKPYNLRTMVDIVRRLSGHP